MTDWPPELDAVIAAPEHHRLVMENEQIRVLETRIRPGETTGLHTHQWPASTYILSWSHCVRRDEHANILMDTREHAEIAQPGVAMWTPALGPHTLENVGDRDIHVITVEIKRA